MPAPSGLGGTIEFEAHEPAGAATTGTAPPELCRFLDLLPDAALVMDRLGCTVLANARAADVFGYAAGELVGERVESLLLQAGLDLLVRLVADHDETPTQTPVAVGVDLDAQHRDGTRFPVEVSVRVFATGPGAGHVLVVSTVRDVSVQRRAADEARSRMAALVDSASLGIVSTTLDGVIASWNGGAEAVLGHPAADMVGTTLGALLAGSCADGGTPLLAMMTPDEPLPAVDVVLPHRDGQEVHLGLSVSPIIDKGRAVIGHSLVFQDITPRKRMEAALAQAKDKAENTSREFEAFSYAVAHDLRAPLRAIDGFSQALLEDYPSAIDEAGQDYLAQMRASAKYMGQLIDSLLSLARLTHGGIELQPVDLSGLARETMRRLQASDPDRQVEVVITDGILGRADPTMLALVLDNLLGNAWKYTRTRDAARIEFGSCTKGEHTTYFVKDNGIGFDMAYSDKLFGVFQRLHAVEAFEGTGIGLATAKKVLQRHGGEIWAYGEVDRGASFLFTLTATDGRAQCLTCGPPEICRPPTVPVTAPADR